MLERSENEKNYLIISIETKTGNYEENIINSASLMLGKKFQEKYGEENVKVRKFTSSDFPKEGINVDAGTKIVFICHGDKASFTLTSDKDIDGDQVSVNPSMAAELIKSLLPEDLKETRISLSACGSLNFAIKLLIELKKLGIRAEITAEATSLSVDSNGDKRSRIDFENEKVARIYKHPSARKRLRFQSSTSDTIEVTNCVTGLPYCEINKNSNQLNFEKQRLNERKKHYKNEDYDFLLELELPELCEAVFDQVNNDFLFNTLLLKNKTDLLKSILIKLYDLPFNRPDKWIFKNFLNSHSLLLGNLEFVEAIFNQYPNYPIDEPDNMDQTVLLWAASKGYKETVSYLIERGAHLNVLSNLPGHVEHGMDPLLWAIKNGHTEVACILINANASIDISLPNNNGKNAFILAAELGNLEVIEAIINQYPNYNINEADYCGQTALLWSAAQGHKEIVNYLIEREANLNVFTNLPDNIAHGMDPLLWAIKNGHTEIALILFNANESMDISLQTNNVKAALILAFELSNFVVVNSILEQHPKELVYYIQNLCPFYKAIVTKIETLLSGRSVNKIDRKKAEVLSNYLNRIEGLQVEGLNPLEIISKVNTTLYDVVDFAASDVRKFRGINFFNRDCETIRVVKEFLEDLNSKFPNLMQKFDVNERESLNDIDTITLSES